MPDMYEKKVQVLTGGDTVELKVRYYALGDGTFALAVSDVGLAQGQLDTNSKLQEVIDAIEALGDPLQFITLIDETTTTDMTYIGYALPTGSAVSESGSHWRIKRIDETSGVTKIKFADGNDDFTHKWSDRVSLTYN